VIDSCSLLNMCSKGSVVNYHTVLLAFASTVSLTALPKSSQKRASSRRPENGQRLTGYVAYSSTTIAPAQGFGSMPMQSLNADRIRCLQPR
jgi:hypothetical protein